MRIRLFFIFFSILVSQEIFSQDYFIGLIKETRVSKNIYGSSSRGVSSIKGTSYYFTINNGNRQLIGKKGSNLELYIKDPAAKKSFKEFNKYIDRANLYSYGQYVGIVSAVIGLVTFSAPDDPDADPVRSYLLRPSVVGGVGVTTACYILRKVNIKKGINKLTESVGLQNSSNSHSSFQKFEPDNLGFNWSPDTGVQLAMSWLF